MSAEASAGPPGTGKEERGASAAQRGQVMGAPRLGEGAIGGIGRGSHAEVCRVASEGSA